MVVLYGSVVSDVQDILDVLTGVVQTYIFIQIHVYIQSPMPPECNTIHPSIHLFAIFPLHIHIPTPLPPSFIEKTA